MESVQVRLGSARVRLGWDEALASKDVFTFLKLIFFSFRNHLCISFELMG